MFYTCISLLCLTNTASKFIYTDPQWQGKAETTPIKWGLRSANEYHSACDILTVKKTSNLWTVCEGIGKIRPVCVELGSCRRQKSFGNTSHQQPVCAITLQELHSRGFPGSCQPRRTHKIHAAHLLASSRRFERSY